MLWNLLNGPSEPLRQSESLHLRAAHGLQKAAVVIASILLKTRGEVTSA